MFMWIVLCRLCHVITLIVAFLLLGVVAPRAVPVVVSTIALSVPAVLDIAVGASGNDILFVSGSAHAVYRLIPPTPGSSVGSLMQHIAGSGSSEIGDADGTGMAARFNSPYAVAVAGAPTEWPTNRRGSVAFVTDRNNCLIRRIDANEAFNNINVSTVAGKSGIAGTADGVGSAAAFNFPIGVTIFQATMLYVADYSNRAIRRIIIATRNVTTIASTAATGDCLYLALTRDGMSLYVSTYNAIVKVNISTGAAATIAGDAASGYRDSPDGPTARFDVPCGIALNGDETALIVVDHRNNRIRRLQLGRGPALNAYNVTTIAGSGVASLTDGADATFHSPHGARWYCSSTSTSSSDHVVCGVLVADYTNAAIRFVPVETRPSTPSATNSASLSSASSFSAHKQLSSTLTQAVPSASRTLVRSSTMTFVSAPLNVSSSRWTTQSTITSPTQSTTLYCAQWVPVLLSGAMAELTSINASSISVVGSSLPLWPVVLLGPAALSDAPMNDSGITAEQQTTTRSVILVVSAPISRQALLQETSPRLVVNLSWVLDTSTKDLAQSIDPWLPDAAAVVNIYPTLFGASRPPLLFPLLTSSDVAVEVLRVATMGERQSTLLALHPPMASSGAAPRWFSAATVSVFRDVTAVIQLRMRCPVVNANAAAAQMLHVTVPFPGRSLELASEVHAAGAVLQYANSFAGPSAASTAGRVIAMRNLVMCDKSATVAAMVQLHISSSCSSGDSSDTAVGGVARGGVIGNLIVWALALVLMGGACLVYSRWCGDLSFVCAAETLGVPSTMIPVMIVTVPSTAWGSTWLLAQWTNDGAPLCAVDVLVATIGLIMLLTLIAGLGATAYVVPRRLMLTESTTFRERGHRWSPAWVRRTISRVFHRHHRWIATPGVAHQLNQTFDACVDSSKNFLSANCSDVPPLRDDVVAPRVRWERLATVVLLECSKLWYMCFDVAVLIAASTLGALSAMDSPAACRASGTVVVLLYAAQLAVCAVSQPLTTLFSHVQTLLTLTLCVISVASQVSLQFILYDSEQAAMPEALMSQLLVVVVVCDVAVFAVSSIRVLMDVSDVVSACRRHLRSAMELRRAAQSNITNGPLRLHDHGDDLVLGCGTTAINAGHYDEATVTVSNLAVNREEVGTDLEVSGTALIKSTVTAASSGHDATLQLLDQYNTRFWNSDGTAAVPCNCRGNEASCSCDSAAMARVQQNYQGDLGCQLW